MIKRLRVKNFKALRDVEVELTPIHVLIGPNDSGKTSILDAMAALCRSVDHDLSEAFLGTWTGSDLVWTGKFGLPVRIEVDFDSGPITGYGLSVLFAERYRREVLVEEETIRRERQEPLTLHGFGPEDRGVGGTRIKHASENSSLQDSESIELRDVKNKLGGVHYYRWEPGSLALPVAPDTKRSFTMESDGFGLTLCLDSILGDNPGRFIELQKRFTGIFPHITSMRLSPERIAYRAAVDSPYRVTILEEAEGKKLDFKLRDTNQWVPASQVSDGVLLVLAYLAILYLPQERRPRVLLVEEPENGMHPQRLREVLEILRELIQEQSHTQVVLTTHSPYVLDLFQPKEVTLCTMQSNGEVKTIRLSESRAVRNQMNVFTLGEIWTSEGDEAIAKKAEEAGR